MSQYFMILKRVFVLMIFHLSTQCAHMNFLNGLSSQLHEKIVSFCLHFPIFHPFSSQGR